jgi:hypothetical protein
VAFFRNTPAGWVPFSRNPENSILDRALRKLKKVEALSSRWPQIQILRRIGVTAVEVGRRRKPERDAQCTMDYILKR